MVKRADAGDIVTSKRCHRPDDTAFEVFAKVTEAAREVLERRIDDIKAGTAPGYRRSNRRRPPSGAGDRGRAHRLEAERAFDL